MAVDCSARPAWQLVLIRRDGGAVFHTFICRQARHRFARPWRAAGVLTMRSLLSSVSHLEGSCDCPHHRQVRIQRNAPAHTSGWTTFLPVVLCAFCPACLSVWAPLLGIVGCGLRLSEEVHGALLGASIALSLLVGIARARRRHLWWPVAVTSLGGVLLISGHLLDDSLPLAVLGCASLLLSAALERRPSWAAEKVAT